MSQLPYTLESDFGSQQILEEFDDLDIPSDLTPVMDFDEDCEDYEYDQLHDLRG